MHLRIFSFLAGLAALGTATAAAAQQQPIEPIDLPPSLEQGVDMIYVDPEIAPNTTKWGGDFGDVEFDPWTGAPLDFFAPVNPLFTELRRGLVRYRMRWGALPQTVVRSASGLKPGASGPEVSLLRERLGLFPLGGYDQEVSNIIREYQTVHGLPVDGVAGPATVESLNKGFGYYERLLLINLERAKRLPPVGSRRRYVIVDAGAARLWMVEDGRPVDSMRVIVGDAKTATPMMAAMLRYVSLNPYWNVPPDFARHTIAPRILAQGISYLTEREYEVLSDWTDDAKLVDPATVDWEAFADGKLENIRLRRKPSPANSMGAMKFMMPNDYGIYLHDTPDKTLFAKDNRWISNGCIRLEDAHRLARWLFGEEPKPRSGQPEERVDLPEPVPVYMTYMTAGPGPLGVVFRKDPYQRDEQVLARYFGGADTVAGG